MILLREEENIGRKKDISKPDNWLDIKRLWTKAWKIISGEGTIKIKDTLIFL